MRFASSIFTTILFLSSLSVHITHVKAQEEQQQQQQRTQYDHRGHLRRTSTSGVSSSTTSYSGRTHSIENSESHADGGTDAGALIIGGTPAEAGAYPWFVHFNACAATLIHEDILLCAAHCAAVRNNNVWIGAYNKDELNNNDLVDKRQVTDRIIHPNYDADTEENDFMIMKLNEPSYHETVKLPRANGSKRPNENNKDLKVMGFGATEEGNRFGNKELLEVDVKSVPYNKCSENYGRNKIFDDTMFCAGDMENGGHDSCQGDSGGPIITKDGTQVGVTSWGRGCGRQSHPGVYARVSSTMEWINEQICDLSENPPSFCFSSSEEEAAVNANAGLVETLIYVDFDRYPDDVGLKITLQKNNGDEEVIINRRPGSFENIRNNIYQETLYLKPSKEYEIEIYDVSNNKNYGQGNIGIYAIPPGPKDDIVLLASYGAFLQMNLHFIVPSLNDLSS